MLEGRINRLTIQSARPGTTLAASGPLGLDYQEDDEVEYWKTPERKESLSLSLILAWLAWLGLAGLTGLDGLAGLAWLGLARLSSWCLLLVSLKTIGG